MSLCPSLANFRFSADAILDLGILNPNDDDLPLPVAPQKNAHFADEDMDMGGFDQDFGGGEEEVERVEVDFFADDDVGGAPSGSGPIENYDPRRVGERDLVVSMSGEQNLDYFDSSMMKNWAGPEHWKMRKVASRRDEGAVAKPREKKIPFIIDFKAPPLIPQKELFAPGLPASIRLAGRKPFQTARERRRTSKLKIKPENYTLPPDYHFSSQMLTRLFLKPKLIVSVTILMKPSTDFLQSVWNEKSKCW